MAEDSEDEDYTFGIKPPPLYITIKEILQEYPDGQIFKEIIQNADDARATEVKFFLDYRHIQTVAPSLSSCPDLELFEGPALLAYNDAGFKKNDWKSIQRPKRSEKAHDCMKVGKFGSGFNSVYHITDLPVILSGERYAFMDPLQIVWPGETGRWWKLSELSGKPDALAGVLGICNFFPDCYNFSNKTLFRFPLRKQRSKLSDDNYTLTKLWNTLEALRKEAKYLLLFLRSVQTIGVYKITHSGQEKVFSVSITEKDWQGRHEKLRHFEEEIKYRLLDMQLAHKMRDVVSFTSQFTVVVAEQGMAEREYEWLVVQQVGSTSEEVLDMVKVFNDRGESVLPWVGTAVELGEPQEPKSGRIFCFLPMPFEKSSPLPVHVNGSFAVSKDRRSLKWPTVERQTDPGALWNELLTKFCLSECYKQLLVSLTLNRAISPSVSYAAWPDPSVVNESEWEGLLVPLFSSLFHEHVFHSVAEGGQWVKLDEAWLSPENGLPETVTNCLLACSVKLVNTNSLVWKIFCFCSLMPFQCISPSFVREVLKLNPGCYRMLNQQQKIELLSYCMNDSEYSALRELELLPLANNTFLHFDQPSFTGDNVYLCTSEFPSLLFPFLEDCLVDVVSDDNLQSHFIDLVKSGCTQVIEVTMESIAYLLSQSISKGWSLTHYHFFWNWVQPYSLNNISVCPVVPVVDNDYEIIKAVRLSVHPKSVLINNTDACRLDTNLLNAFKKIGVVLARQDMLGFLRHREILKYINTFTPDGVMTSTNFSGNIFFTVSESDALQTFMASSNITLNTSVKVLCRLPIFRTLQHGNDSLFSINKVANGTPFALAEDSTSLFLITAKFLPLQPLVIAQRGFSNNTFLLSQMETKKMISLITMTDFACSIVFPLIRQNLFPYDKLNGFMMEVMQLLTHAFSETDRNKVLAEMKTVPFLLNNNNVLKCPTELFDCNCDTVMSLYKGEPVFPLPPFNAMRYSPLLQCAGLKCEQDVTALNIYEIVDQIKCNGISPQKRGVTEYTRACALMKFLSENPSLLNKLTNRSFYYSFDTLFDDLTRLSHTTSWLPVCFTPPTDYPRCLSWKGSIYPNCLASQAAGIAPLSPKLPLIAGSQLLFMQDAAQDKLTLKLRPPQNVLVQAVAKHFNEVTRNFKSIDWYVREKIINWTYTYLRDNGGHIVRHYLNKKWIWLENRCDFVEPKSVALHPNNNFYSNLEPFITVLPVKYEQFHDIFEKLGVSREITTQQILLVLKMIKESTDIKVSPNQAWQMVIDILHWVADNSDEIEFEEVLVPVQSSNRYPVLKSVDEVAYSDSNFIINAAICQQQPCSIVNHRIPSDLYKKLSVKPLSEYLGVSAEMPVDVGQQEPLIQRLKNILKDYKDGLTIIKELLQNADDAEATELNIIYDSRNHKSDVLLFPGMAKAHGPALIVHNDQTFTDEDFENITKLAGATKEDKPLKIGKFGVGFCSVYHITDVPSFVSGEWLYIFDPTLKHLVVKNPAQPGQKILCTSTLLRGSQQLDPYHSIFKYTPGHSYNGTIFRLPFRTCESELSNKRYRESDILSLREQLIQEGSKLLMFLRHVKKITFSEWKLGERAPQHHLLIDQTDGVKIAENVQLVKLRTNTTFSSIEEWIVSSCLSEHDSSNMYQSAAVACRLMPSHERCYKVSPVCGESFCSLPLASQTGLPVHVSANFAVTSNRREIWSSTSDDPEKEVRWNRELMRSAIPYAYSQLLICLKELVLDEHDMSLQEYTFHSLWPLKANLQHVNPWYILIDELYSKISAQALFYSQPRLRWLHLSDCKFICTKIFDKLSFDEPPKCVAQGLEILGEPTVDLPEEFHCYIPDMTFIDESEFINIFLNHISSFSSHADTRNEIIVLVLELYAWHTERRNPFNCELLTSTPCIPCTPSGNLKLCKNLVDPTSPIAELFTPSDGYFPIKMLCDSQPALRAMRILGLQTETVSYEVLAHCAKQIPCLYHKNKEKALGNMVLILTCVEKHLELDVSSSNTKCEILKNIPFLPVMQKPEKYVLPWYGEIMLFQSPCNLMHGPKLPDIVGSQVAIFDTGIGSMISSHVLSHIGVKTQPNVSTVVTQLKCLLEIDLVTTDKDAIGHTYSVICNFLEDLHRTEAHFDDEILDMDEIKTLPCVWTGKLFVKPDCVAKNWKCDGPILYPVPEALRSRTALQKSLGCKDLFSIADLLNALSLLYKAGCSEPLNEQCQELVREIVADLDKFKEDEFEMYSERDNLTLPDTKFVMCKVSDLVFNDVEWDSDSNRIVHGCVTISLAKKLGVMFIRNKVLQRSELRKIPGLPFGQRETLQRRISSILQQYPFDVTFMKEVLQNADDAKATKLCVILDKRQLVSKKSQMISDNWKELQGPALLLWNNSTFTDKDLQGIQDLGTGGKRGDSDTIGQFGIGFSVVYHVTDCPSIITSVDGVRSLCVFDPLCKYVPGADISNPGRRFEINEKFWKKFPVMKQGYNIDKLDGCPKYMRRELWKGSLFRLPIRKISESEDSEFDHNPILTESTCTPDVVTTEYLLHHIEQWIEDVKLSLLFFNHLTDIEFYVINEVKKPQMTLLARHSSTLSEEAKKHRNDIECAVRSFLSPYSAPKVVLYPITITSLVQSSSLKMKHQKELWLVQEGIGDICFPDRQWMFVPNVKPRHGLAAALQPGQFTKGQVFCFLPLPCSFNLPVHINGQFMLGNTRRHLWTPSNPKVPDDRSSWNDYLLEAIGSSYAQFLQDAIPHFVKECYENYDTAKSDLIKYYTKFPIHHESESQIRKKVLETVLQQNARILCSLKESESSSCNQYETKWAPIKDKDPLNQSYMFPTFEVPKKEDSELSELPMSKEDIEKKKEKIKKLKESHDRLRFLLAKIGMNINSVPGSICRALDIPIAKGKEVLSFCKHFPEKIGALPCPIEETSINSVENFAALLDYVCTHNEQHLQFISDDHISAPFLLTANHSLQIFTEDHCVIFCEHLDLFTHSSVISHFAHLKMIEMNIDPAYFYQTDEESFDFVREIFTVAFPHALHNFEGSYTDLDTSDVLPSTITNIWKCLTRTRVFSYHLKAILQKWALIPSQQNQLFLYCDNVLPVDVCRSSLQDKLMQLKEQSQSSVFLMDDEMENVQLYLHVSEILEKLEMPVLDVTIVSSECLSLLQCTCDLPSILKPETVLKNLKYWNQLHPIQLENVEWRHTLFQYFSQVTFGNQFSKNPNKDHICSLQLFQNIDGSLTCLTEKKVYIWPDHIELAGLSQWLPHDCVFLEENGKWKNLGVDQAVLSIKKKINSVSIYEEYIFPQFSKLSEADRYKHLEHIKNYLLKLFRNDIQPIKQLFAKSVCIEDEHGELRCVKKLYDTSVDLFHTFSPHFLFPHEKYRNKVWLPFFRKMGMQQEVTMDKYEELCRLVENGKHENISKASINLLEYLLHILWHYEKRRNYFPEAEDWSSPQNRDFLERVFEISFVVTETLPQLNWIVEQCAASNCLTSGDHLTKLNGAAISDVADIVWTVRPVIRLPDEYSYTSNKQQFHLLSDMGLGLITQPSLSDVLDNVHNIVSQSKFGNIILFDQYNVEFEVSNECNLLRVMSKSFERLRTDVAKELDLIRNSLGSLKCIPVFATQPNWFILVEPQCVIVSSSVEEFRPFLNPLPKDLVTFMSDVLEHIGVKHELGFEHCRYALEKMHHCSSDQKQVDVNTQAIVEKLIKRMYTIMQDQSSIANITTATLYLPSIHFKLMPSNCLVYCDEQRYRHCRYTISENSSVSVLWLPNSFDGASVKMFCKFLPENVQPKPFSSHCKQVLHSQNFEIETNVVTKRFQETLHMHKIIHALESILNDHQIPPVQCQLLLQYFQDALYCAKVVSIPNLMVKLHFQNTEILEADGQELAICKVDYFVQEDRHALSKIYIDASVSDLTSARLKVYLQIAQHMLINIASIDNPQDLLHIISSLLEAQTEEQIVMVFNSYNLEGSSIPLSSTTVAITPKLGASVPECIHHMMDQDVKKIFQPGEWVAFDENENDYIFAMIAFPNCNEIGRMPDNIYDHEYYINISDDELCCISIIELYKFLRSSHTNPQQTVDLDDDNAVDRNIPRLYRDEILEALDEILRFSQKRQQTVIRRLLLRWHPDKNLDNIALAQSVFTFLVNLIETRHLCTTQMLEECNKIANRHRQAAERDPPVYEHFEISYPPDIPEARCWLGQAKIDKTVLDIVLNAAIKDGKLSGHVCFLAHEVAEKALKAGMYAVHGRRTDAYLRDHHIEPLYKNIADRLPEGSCRILVGYICVLSSRKYYLKTRFPNQWYDSSPANHFTQEQAREAQEIAKYIIQTVETLIPQA